ncbi:hypothetical protein ACL58G_09240 [Massilia sp. GER05]|uniref:hypothetical protein n=1 Tax=Massilia sp. GER05 TaxID=3394605 RepID=UPI003F82ADCB
MAKTDRKLKINYTALRNRCRPRPTLERMIMQFSYQADSDGWSKADILDVVLDACTAEDPKELAKYCSEPEK